MALQIGDFEGGDEREANVKIFFEKLTYFGR